MPDCNWITVLQGLLTPVIALIALYIAWQQWRTNRQKLKWDLYDRRLRIFEEVRKILSLVLRDANANREDLLRFRTSVADADFLFGPEITDYIDEIYSSGLRLARWNDQYIDATQPQPPGYDHQQVVDEMHKELTWLIEQFEPAKKKFRPYLEVLP